MIGNVLVLFAIVTVLHAAYSTYEHLSYLKALGRPEGAIPQDIVVEAIAALVIGVVGAAVRTPELREMTWRSEMKRRATLDHLDPRMSFATFARRAGIALPQDPSPKSG